MKLWNYIKESMLCNPYQFICEDGDFFTYKETISKVESFAQKIIAERCCVISCSSELSVAIAVLSCFAAGVTAVPSSMRYGKTINDRIIDMISPTAIITDSSSGVLHKIPYTGEYRDPEVSPALIMYTSGTSGSPKGVMLSERNLITNINDIVDYFDINNNDTILISRPLYHSAVLTGEFLVSLINGTRIVFSAANFNPRYLWGIIDDYDVTVFCGTPTMLSMMARFIPKKDNHIKKLCISGECLSFEDGKRIASAFPNAKIYHVYGLTEASPRVCYLPPQYFNENPDYVGIPLKSVNIKIINHEGRLVNEDEDGFLYVQGDSVMLGYYNDPKLTKKTIRNGWLYTGDIASINSDGFIKIKGRNDDLIIRAGVNIYPQEIERILKTDHRVKDVYIYGYKNRYGGQQIGMKISGDFVDIDEVVSLCLDVLPGFQIPSSIELLKELQKTESGKIFRGETHA